MNERIKKLWVDALRSGEYRQGRNLLCTEGEDGDYFCCLGVLCELHAQEHARSGWESAGFVDKRSRRPVLRYSSRPHSLGGNDTDEALLPSPVARWAGLPSTDGYIGKAHIGYGGSLVEMNDRGLSFDKIADVIEAQL